MCQHVCLPWWLTSGGSVVYVKWSLVPRNNGEQLYPEPQQDHWVGGHLPAPWIWREQRAGPLAGVGALQREARHSGRLQAQVTFLSGATCAFHLENGLTEVHLMHERTSALGSGSHSPFCRHPICCGPGPSQARGAVTGRTKAFPH